MGWLSVNLSDPAAVAASTSLRLCANEPSLRLTDEAGISREPHRLSRT